MHLEGGRFKCSLLDVIVGKLVYIVSLLQGIASPAKGQRGMLMTTDMWCTVRSDPSLTEEHDSRRQYTCICMQARPEYPGSLHPPMRDLNPQLHGPVAQSFFHAQKTAVGEVLRQWMGRVP